MDSMLQHGPQLAGIGLCIWICDRFIPARVDASFRWFVLHVIINLMVIIFSLSDLVDLLHDPLHVNYDVSTVPKNAVLALHVYHALMFDNLTFIDWVHHSIMCCVIMMIGDGGGGSLVNWQMFFTSGLPGGFDYIMLIAVKMGWMTSLNEKRWNAWINHVLRGPGILIGAVLIYIHNPFSFVLVYTLLALFWNAQYFSYRVAVNYGSKLC